MQVSLFTFSGFVAPLIITVGCLSATRLMNTRS